MINLKDIKPVTVSTDLASYSSLIYGSPKIGKTTFVHDLYGDRVLHIMTEKRFKALAGAYVQYVGNWTEYLQVMRQLKQDEFKEKFDVISIDTVDNLFDFLSKYVAAKYKENQVGERKDIWGADWKDLKEMWKDGLLKIEKEDYVPVFVSHSTQTTTRIPKNAILEANEEDLKDFNEVVDKKDGQTYLEFTKYVPDMKDRAMSPINKMVDNILFLTQTTDTTGKEHRVIHTRESLQWLAGSTFQNIKSPIPLDSESYKKAVTDAIMQVPKKLLSDDKKSDSEIKVSKLDFDELMKNAKKLGAKYAKANRMDIVKNIVDEVFGTDEKLTNATIGQVQQLSEAIGMLQDQLYKIEDGKK